MRFYQFFVRILCKCLDFLDFPAIYHLCFYSSQSPGYLKESEGCFVFFGCRFREKIVEKVQKIMRPYFCKMDPIEQGSNSLKLLAL